MFTTHLKTTGKYNSVLELIKRVNSMFYRNCMTKTDIAKMTKTSPHIVRRILTGSYVVHVQFRNLKITTDITPVTFHGNDTRTICILDGLYRDIDWVKTNMKVVR